MSFYLGIDGGGSKTEAIICDSNGHMHAHILSASVNPNDIDMKSIKDIFHHMVLALLKRAEIDIEQIASVFAGVAGASNYNAEITGLLCSLFPKKIPTQVGSDAINILSCGLLNEDGCAIICGTDAACFVRRGDEIFRIGGWGYLLEQYGGGYSIGRDCIAGILREYDGRGVKTILSAMAVEHFGKHPSENLTEIYRKGKSYIAQYALLVFEALSKNDFLAQQIIENNAKQIAENIDTASCYFADKSSGFIVVMGGGVIKNHPEMIEIIKSQLKCHAQLRLIPTSPVFGAVIEAMKINGETVHQGLIDIFSKEYLALQNNLK